MTHWHSACDICSVLYRWDRVPLKPELFLLMWAHLFPLEGRQLVYKRGNRYKSLLMLSITWIGLRRPRTIITLIRCPLIGTQWLDMQGDFGDVINGICRDQTAVWCLMRRRCEENMQFLIMKSFWWKKDFCHCEQEKIMWEENKGLNSGRKSQTYHYKQIIYM